jgi:hypothetical protein
MPFRVTSRLAIDVASGQLEPCANGPAGDLDEVVQLCAMGDPGLLKSSLSGRGALVGGDCGQVTTWGGTGAVETVAVYASRRQLVRSAVVCGLFAVAGVWMVATGNVLVGLACLIFFGGMGISAYVPRLLNPKPLFELTPTGFRPLSGGVVPWQDIEDVGIGILPRAGGVVGLRLSDYTAYIQSAPAKMPSWKRLDAWTAARSMPHPAQLGTADLSGPQRNLVALLAWNRKKTGGLDMCWLHRFFSEPPESIASQILAYRATALNL